MSSISFRLDIFHTLCTLCHMDCYQKTFFSKNCGHSSCMNCISVYFDGLKKDITYLCPACNIVSSSKHPITPASKEELSHRQPHGLPQGHTKEASLLP